MGKATRWLKGLLGMKREKENWERESSGDRRENKRWSFHRSGKAPATAPARYDGDWQDVTTALRLAKRGREKGYEGDTHWAAIKARKALRALKGLVKIQALVRGYLVRKKAAATLYSMQALMRAQNSARSQRARRSINKENRFSTEFRGRRSMEKFYEGKNEFYYSKRLPTSYENPLSPFEQSPKIVEIDTYKPKSRSRRTSASISDYSDDPYYQPISSPLPCPLTSRISVPKSQNYENYEYGFYDNEYKFFTAQSTPRFATSYKYNGPPTPSKSVCGDSLLRLYSNYPSYMANTQSFSAKLRSQSAPRQRPELTTKKRMSLDEILASRCSLSGVKMQRSCSQVQQTLNI